MRIFCWLSLAFGSTTLLVPVLMIQNGRPTATRLILAKLGRGWGWSQWLIQGLLFCLPILISLPLALMISHCVNAINIDGFTKKTTDKRSFKIMASNKQAPVDSAKYISWLHKRHTWRVYLFQKCLPKKIKFFYFKLIFVWCFQIILIFKKILFWYISERKTLWKATAITLPNTTEAKQIIVSFLRNFINPQIYTKNLQSSMSLSHFI